MKISVIFVAGARGCGVRDWNPQSCGFVEWITKNLWESAVESFNFASKNWEEFTNTVKSVSRTGHFWKENNKIFKFDGYDVPSSDQFRYLDSNRDSEISAEEFNGGHFVGTPFNGHFQEFSAKYWPVFDIDKSGTMNFEENQYLYAAVNDGAARLVLKVGKLRYS